MVLLFGVVVPVVVVPAGVLVNCGGGVCGVVGIVVGGYCYCCSCDYYCCYCYGVVVLEDSKSVVLYLLSLPQVPCCITAGVLLLLSVLVLNSLVGVIILMYSVVLGGIVTH